MKKLFVCSIISSSFFIGLNPLKADYDYWGIKYINQFDGYTIYTINSSTGLETERKTFCAQVYYGESGNVCGGQLSDLKIDNTTGNLLWSEKQRSRDSTSLPSKQYSYNLNDNSITEVGSAPSNWKDGYSSTNIIEIPLLVEQADGSIQIGSNDNDIDITAEGLNIDGNPLITKKDNGEIHIGKNSLITSSEEQTLSDGTKVQPLYAKDAEGNKIPINIDGSKLLIDGVEVTAGAGGNSAQVTTNKNNISTNTSNIATNTSNIKSLGEGVAGSTALTAALSSLPQTSKESKLSCGVGTGAYSSKYALGFGCASKVNDRVDVNAGGSYVFGGSKSYGEGTLDSGVIKAGFVFKLGELKKPTLISMQDTKEMKKKIKSLEEKNQQLITRLERLEKVALGESNSKDLATIKLP